jgi:ribosome-interacting GTPase 1
MIGMIKIYTKIPGKAVEKRPVALKKGAAIKDLADEIHKDFIKKFKYAKVIRPESRIKERHVGLKFILEDNDIVELHTK